MVSFFFFSLFQLELLAAKNLIGANLNGTSDPYAIITCGEQKRFRWLYQPFFSIDDIWNTLHLGLVCLELILSTGYVCKFFELFIFTRKAPLNYSFKRLNLQHLLCSITQGNKSVDSYFTELNAIWEELRNCRPFRHCCVGSVIVPVFKDLFICSRRIFLKNFWIVLMNLISH